MQILPTIYENYEFTELLEEENFYDLSNTYNTLFQINEEIQINKFIRSLNFNSKPTPYSYNSPYAFILNREDFIMDNSDEYDYIDEINEDEDSFRNRLF